MKFLITLLAAFTLTACATSQDQVAYYGAIKAKAEAEATSNAIIAIARFRALSEIAASGDTTAKVSAAMAIQGNNGQSQAVTSSSNDIAKPESGSDVALRWAGFLVPASVQATGMYLNAKLGTTQSNNATTLGLRQSDNAAAVQMNTNATMQGIAGMIPTVAGMIPTP